MFSTMKWVLKQICTLLLSVETSKKDEEINWEIYENKFISIVSLWRELHQSCQTLKIVPSMLINYYIWGHIVIPVVLLSVLGFFKN